MKIFKYLAFGLISIFAIIGAASVAGYFAITYQWTNVSGVVDSSQRYLAAVGTTTLSTTTTDWAHTEEWITLKKAIATDKPTITRVATETAISPRLLVAPLVVEQLRLFTSQREIYKEIFKPLQILGIQSQFSWGVMGLKQETAIQIEKNLISTSSPYYLGTHYEHMLDFSSTDQNTERFDRIVARDHYYSYLYTALYIKQILSQWQNAGFSIENHPEIVATLFNIGFEHSKPNALPLSGGAEIEIHAQKYSFGELARQFYYSDELLAEFPR